MAKTEGQFWGRSNTVAQEKKEARDTEENKEKYFRKEAEKRKRGNGWRERGGGGALTCSDSEKRGEGKTREKRKVVEGERREKAG